MGDEHGRRRACTAGRRRGRRRGRLETQTIWRGGGAAAEGRAVAAAFGERDNERTALTQYSARQKAYLALQGADGSGARTAHWQVERGGRMGSRSAFSPPCRIGDDGRVKRGSSGELRLIAPRTALNAGGRWREELGA